MNCCVELCGGWLRRPLVAPQAKVSDDQRNFSRLGEEVSEALREVVEHYRAVTGGPG